MPPRKPKIATPEQLAALAELAPWTPPDDGRHRHGPECRWPARSRTYRSLPAYVRPSERSGLNHPLPGPEDMPDEVVKAWIAEEPFVRGGLRWETAQALAYLETFGRHA